MTTLTIHENVKIEKTNFKTVNDMLDYFLDYNKKFNIELENWTEEDNEILNNRSKKMKDDEKDIQNILQGMKW